MGRTSRLIQAVTMPAAIGTESFLLIGVASLLHAKAIEPPLNMNGELNVSVFCGCRVCCLVWSVAVTTHVSVVAMVVAVTSAETSEMAQYGDAVVSHVIVGN